MARRMFDHMYAEISVAVGRRIPRYALWLRFHDLGWNPEALDPANALAFCDGPLEDFLVERRLGLSRRAHRRLRRAIAGFDPRHPTPDERLANWVRAI